MQTKSKKVLSTLLALALVFSLFMAAPVIAGAMGADDLAVEISRFEHGGNGKLIATADGNRVIVTGTVTGVQNTLELDIDSDVTVVWSAEYSRDNESHPPTVGADAWFVNLIQLTGKGTFDVVKGGSLVNYGQGNAISADGAGVNIVVSGGEVRAAGSLPLLYSAIRLAEEGNSVTVTAGVVESSGFGIYSFGARNTINVNEGVVSGGTTGGCAIYIDGDNSRINITGGKVYTLGEGGVAIVTGENNSNMLVNVSGGFVFSYGYIVSGNSPACAIRYWAGNPVALSGSAVVCAWDYSAGNRSYTADTSDDLFLSEGASAIWAMGEFTGGIEYANNQNTGFFPINGLMVEPAADEPVAEEPTAPTNLTATAGESGIVLTWNFDFDAAGALNTADKFHIARVEGIGESSGYDNAPMDTTTYTDVGVEAGKSYTYYVYFSRGGVMSDGAGPATATMPGAVESAGGMSNFVKINTYTPGMFDDVPEDAWYGAGGQGVVITAYEYGLMLGNGADSFGPMMNLRVAEAITVATRVRRTYMGGDDGLSSVEPSGLWGEAWYSDDMDYAVAYGIIAANDFSVEDLLRNATRAEMAYIFAGALPQEEYPSQNTVNSLPDVNAASPYWDAIKLMYEAGIVAGSDSQGSFNPGNNITRAEASALLTRVILPETRFSGNVYG